MSRKWFTTVSVLLFLILMATLMVASVSAQSIFDAECPNCHGTGQITVEKIDPVCQGTGKIESKLICTICGGSGYLTDWPKVGVTSVIGVGAIIGSSAFVIMRKKKPSS